jgi:low affinity Fe/Cu permease
MKQANTWFAEIANATGKATGHPLAFILSMLAVVVWGISGPIFGFSDTWQLVINTGTTVITYLLLFVVQNSQNRNAAALHIKLDEILRAMPEARTDLVASHIEDAPDEKIDKERKALEELIASEK